MILFATSFRICVNHRVLFASLGKASRRSDNLWIVVSLFDALSQVMLRIQTDWSTRFGEFEFLQFLSGCITYPYLVRYHEIIKNLSRCRSKIKPRTRFRNLNNIEQLRLLDAVEFEGDCNGNICLMVWWGPSIVFETQSSIMLLHENGLWRSHLSLISDSLEKHFSYPLFPTNIAPPKLRVIRVACRCKWVIWRYECYLPSCIASWTSLRNSQ